MGDKHLVLDVAQLAIDAAHRAGPSEEATPIEAQALICGRWWVYQRIGRLAEARTFALRSLELGENVGWDRNTAYCQKCIGRLCRMEAELERDDGRRADLLAESVSRLEEAIERFGRMADFGPSHPEVGECHSLLARTHLVAGRMGEARREAVEGVRRLLDPTSKDYVDLKILLGDIAASEGDRTTADQYYDEALLARAGTDAERSEILARAYYRRGLNRAEGGQTGAAVHDLRQAAEIWLGLDEHKSAARASWEEIRLSQYVPTALQERLGSETLVVRVATIREYRKRLAAFREEPPEGVVNPGSDCCEQIIREARRWVAVHVVDW